MYVCVCVRLSEKEWIEWYYIYCSMYAACVLARVRIYACVFLCVRVSAGVCVHTYIYVCVCVIMRIYVRT